MNKNQKLFFTFELTFQDHGYLERCRNTAVQAGFQITFIQDDQFRVVGQVRNDETLGNFMKWLQALPCIVDHKSS